ncbi:hypothetical protein C2845_PM06G27720 [Panicum miliaceum]|uniref:Gnk2-homologous domain-containing protein n=1 Tax=Panicum miliaceum TaxID=4540 RepID=A0A3L6RCH6_PANMI|nr:hypothetical protein C2845_PM06G27720 [Panicum miliaceum]
MAPPFAARVPVLVLALLVAVAAALVATTPLAVAQPWAVCDGQGGNYSAGSPYASNLLQLVLHPPRQCLQLARALRIGLRWRRGGCRGGRRLRPRALPWQPQRLNCFVRLAGADFLAPPNNTGMVPLISGTNIPSGVDVAAYDAAVTRLLNATAHYAVDRDSSPPSSSPRLYFATGQLVRLDPRVPNIWSIPQCAGDLSQAQCRGCLSDLVAAWWNGSGFEPKGREQGSPACGAT